MKRQHIFMLVVVAELLACGGHAAVAPIYVEDAGPPPVPRTSTPAAPGLNASMLADDLDAGELADDLDDLDAAEDAPVEADLCTPGWFSQLECYGTRNPPPPATSGYEGCEGGPGCYVYVDPLGANPPVVCCPNGI